MCFHSSLFERYSFTKNRTDYSFWNRYALRKRMAGLRSIYVEAGNAIHRGYQMVGRDPKVGRGTPIFNIEFYDRPNI
jgi:hypothetical protein